MERGADQVTVYLQFSAGSLAHREPLFVRPGDSLRTAATTLWAAGVGALIVGDAKEPLGVLGEGDVIAQLCRGADPDLVTARDALSGRIISVPQRVPAVCAASVMVAAGASSVAVTDETGAVVGLVSGHDLLRPLLR